MKISGIYLAAGNSSRMGRHKLSLPAGSSTVGSLALEIALHSSLDNIYVIVKDSDDAAWLPSAVKKHEKCIVVQCPCSRKGQSATLRFGIQQAQDADAVIVMLADQPFITADMIERLIHCVKSSPAIHFAATAYGETIAPPILFSSAMYDELSALQGDKGARAILHGPLLAKGILLPCTDSNALFDIDTAVQYEQFKKLIAAK